MRPERSTERMTPTYAAAVNSLRARGLRVSGARRLVLRALYEADAPVTAEQVAGGLEGRLPASDLASVRQLCALIRLDQRS